MKRSSRTTRTRSRLSRAVVAVLTLSLVAGRFTGVSAAPILAAVPATGLTSVSPIEAVSLPAYREPALRSQGGSRVLTRAELAQLHPVAIPERTYRRALQRHLGEHFARPRHAFRHDAGLVGTFLSDDAGYIWEISTKGTVVGYLTDCSGAEGTKVDTIGNLWVACTNTSTINMYAPGASSATLTLSDTTGGSAFYAADVALDEAGNVYATNLYGYYCPTSSCYKQAGNIVYWAAANVANGATPTGVVQDANIASGYFLDADLLGNVYADYAGSNPSCPGYGLDQIVAPQSGTPTVNTIISPCGSQLQFPGGVYTSNFQMQVDVLDQVTKVTTEYPLVGNSVQPPSGTLAPTPQGSGSSCDPVSMGWSQTDSQVAVGDSGCQALDLGVVATNMWSQEFNADFVVPISAAYTTSDKNQPQLVGQYHTLVIQTMVENFTALGQIAGSNQTGQGYIEAMLADPTIPSGTKNLVGDLLAVPQVTGSSACQQADAQLASGLSKLTTVKAQIAYLTKQQTQKTSCVQLPAGIGDAIALLKAGESTIYNAKWEESHVNKGSLVARNQHCHFWCHVNWAEVAAADAVGAIAGAAGGPALALALAIAFSASNILCQRFGNC